MNWLPPTITNAANSTKAVTFWILLALFLPATREVTGLDIESLQWLTIGFAAWVLSQGMSDFGKGKVKAENGKK